MSGARPRGRGHARRAALLDPDGPGPRVVAIDTGIKRSIVETSSGPWRARGAAPASASVDELLARRPDAVFLANGPGDPAALDGVVETVRGLVGRVPVFGICLGHQLLCRAVGLETFKLPFGHRGANHPVKDLATGRIEITSQNHGFAVRGPGGERTVDASRAVRWHTDFGPAELSHVNLYDRTVEGLVLSEARGLLRAVPPRGRPRPARRPPPVRRFPPPLGRRASAAPRRHRGRCSCSARARS